MEVKPPPPVPPKPPIPALPVYFGAMNFGDGPMAILSVNSGAPQEATRPGEMIGPFKLIDITRQDLTLEWDGELIRKPIDELTNHNAAPPDSASSGRTEASAGQTYQARVELPSAKGPGGDVTHVWIEGLPAERQHAVWNRAGWITQNGDLDAFRSGMCLGHGR